MGREVVQGIAIGLVAIVVTVSIGSYIAQRLEAAHHGGRSHEKAAHGTADSGGQGGSKGEHEKTNSGSH
ncbi:MAG: hypothetical protein ABEL76_00910 [Bradymonadaceae bacterium]